MMNYRSPEPECVKRLLFELTKYRVKVTVPILLGGVP